jgi:tRNA G18 (ribose-2'-O)-methylase SpoU
MSVSFDVSVPQLFLLIENSRKANNLGSILRCASAFGVTTVVTIGFSKCSVQGMYPITYVRPFDLLA